MKLYYVLFFALAAMFAGCQSNQLATDDLKRVQEVSATLAVNHDEAERILLRWMATEQRAKHMLQARVDIMSLAKDGKVDVAAVNAALDALDKAEAKSGVIRDNWRDKVAFLNQQEERLQALTHTLTVYIGGKESIVELMVKQAKQAMPDPITTQPTTQPNK